ncbi:MAG TPA: cbb3-type cytochrome c oxidase subunit 3 [Rudaea sp.]|nr:cbb3-type cytochrome c oxidase subunit 3 [Rudaea sp.]
MNPLWLHLAGVITVILMLTFVGIWIWAWNARHAPTFARLARLPLADESVSARHVQDAKS